MIINTSSPIHLTSCCSALLSRPSRAARRLSSADEWAVGLTLLCLALWRRSSVPDITAWFSLFPTLESGEVPYALTHPFAAKAGDTQQNQRGRKQAMVGSVLNVASSLVVCSCESKFKPSHRAPSADPGMASLNIEFLWGRGGGSKVAVGRWTHRHIPLTPVSYVGVCVCVAREPTSKPHEQQEKSDGRSSQRHGGKTSRCRYREEPISRRPGQGEQARRWVAAHARCKGSRQPCAPSLLRADSTALFLFSSFSLVGTS